MSTPPTLLRSMALLYLYLYLYYLGRVKMGMNCLAGLYQVLEQQVQSPEVQVQVQLKVATSVYLKCQVHFCGLR